MNQIEEIPKILTIENNSDLFSRVGQGIKLKSVMEFDEEIFEKLRRLTLVSDRGQPSGLHGRGSLLVATLPQLGEVCLKTYRRGGVLRALLGRTYLRFGPTRGEEEFFLLQKVRALGVRAPQPLAFIDQGALLYWAWLLMRYVPHQRTLADGKDVEEDVMQELVNQVSVLIHNRIWHVDLHPGNILIDANQKPWLVDFDKAKIFGGSLRELRDHYLIRWRRAVIKHGLPERLSELMCQGLRRIEVTRAEATKV